MENKRYIRIINVLGFSIFLLLCILFGMGVGMFAGLIAGVITGNYDFISFAFSGGFLFAAIAIIFEIKDFIKKRR